MKKEVIIKHKGIEDYKIILKIEVDKEFEDLLKKKLYLLALELKMSNEQSEILDEVYGFYWYKQCEIIY